MQISKDKVVYFSYKLTDTNGDIIDQTQGDDSFPYIHGHQNIVPGLEQALEGLKQGDKKTVNVAANLAYGDYDAEAVFQVPRANFPKEITIEPGMQFDSDGPEGPMSVTVTEVAADMVTVDANHPLAGVDLVFDVEIKSIREATPQEIAHGHVHHGGHDH